MAEQPAQDNDLDLTDEGSAKPIAQGYAIVEGVYVLFSRISVHVDEAGSLWTNPAWAQDLNRHFEYIPRLKLCAPVIAAPPPPDSVEIRGRPDFALIPLKHDGGWTSVLRNFLPNFVTVLRALRDTDIAHSDGAGWAFPLSFYLLPARVFRRFVWIVVIESSFWRTSNLQKAPLRRRIGEKIYELLLKPAVRNADARIFTHDGYRRYFLREGDPNYLINPACWVETSDLIDERALGKKFRERGAKGPLRVVFAARLVTDKGALDVAQAIELVRDAKAPIEFVILGDGPLRSWFEALQAKHRKWVSYLGAVPYGQEFFELISSADVILSVSTSEEQPRILFDAFSQGVPVIATSTDGNRCVADDKTALFVPPGNAEALADALLDLAENPNRLEAMAFAALSRMNDFTHARMHETRSRYIAGILARRRDYA